MDSAETVTTEWYVGLLVADTKRHVYSIAQVDILVHIESLHC